VNLTKINWPFGPHGTDRWHASILLRRLLFGIACLTATIGSFLLTLWLTEDGNQSSAAMDARSASERLAIRHVANLADLPLIAEEIGLKASRQMAGMIETISRTNEREVTIGGWLADPEGDASPQQLVVFVSGAVAGKGETKGERSDVTSAKGLAFGTEKNVAFTLNFACQTGNQPVVVALGSRNQYFPLGSPPCP
jgi:hypothetical protein